MARDKNKHVSVTMGDGSPVEPAFKELKDILVIGISNGLNTAMNNIGLLSVKDFMIGSGTANPNIPPPNPHRLTIRSRRLARAMTDSFVFSVSKIPSVPGLGKPTSKSKFARGKKEGIRKITFSKGSGKIKAEIGNKVPYGRKHELGEGVPKRSYILPAVRAYGNRIAKDVDEEINAALRKKDWN